MSDSLQPHGLWPARPLCPWRSRQDTEVGCHSLFQGILLTQGWNQGLRHHRQTFYCFSHQFSSLSRVRLFATPWTAARQASLSITKELAQTHVHQVGDAIQPSHPLSSPSPPAFNPSQHHGLFQRVSSSHQVAKVLELQLQHLHQSFQ